MDKNPQNKDEAFEALDFIVNVLKEHEKDLDKLINELATVTEQIGEAGELSGQVEKVEEKISSLQKEVTSLVSYLSVIENKDAQSCRAKANDKRACQCCTYEYKSCYSRGTFDDDVLQAMG